MDETHLAAKADGPRERFGSAPAASEQGTKRPVPERWEETRSRLMAEFVRVRHATEALAARLSPEDQGLQSMPECSPAKWHRAHTTWFFEQFLLTPAGVSSYRAEFAYLFNSYYENAGARHPRPQRGILSRPSVEEVSDYRRVVDQRLLEWLERLKREEWLNVSSLLELGIAHEQQHQELLLTDVLHAFALNPLKPVYSARDTLPPVSGTALRADQAQRSKDGSELERSAIGGPAAYRRYAGGVVEIGADSNRGFCFDNESPRHRVYIEPFELATWPIVISEVKAFIEAGGYHTGSLWLSEGLDWVRRTGVQAPLHSSWQDGELRMFTLRGELTPSDDMIAAHLNFYEADAIARFLGARLPTEAEWELAASQDLNCADQPHVNWVESGRLMPSSVAGSGANGVAPWHLYGDVWEWTSSAYSPYPGYEPAPGAVGEYNGKFMLNQQVLRGGSCLTPAGHIRTTYRNFWPAMTSFQMTGARLARSL